MLNRRKQVQKKCWSFHFYLIRITTDFKVNFFMSLQNTFKGSPRLSNKIAISPQQQPENSTIIIKKHILNLRIVSFIHVQDDSEILNLF